jgi:toxin ParE1/3/4
VPTYQLSDAAQQDLREIQRYTRETWGVAQARAYLLELTAAFTKLARRPKLGRQRTDLDLKLRSYIAGKHLVFFRETASGIEVIRVLHTSMDVPQTLEGKE